MRKRVFTFLKNKRFITAFFLLTAIAGLTVTLEQTSAKREQLSALSNGLDTCFIRVGQSYTAKLLKQDSSGYLSPEFMKMSEDCMGDVLAMSENQFAKQLMQTVKKLNAFASEVHTFHEKLSAKVLVVGQGLITTKQENLNIRFTELEGTKEKVRDGIQQFNSSLGSSKKLLTLLLAIASGLFVLLLVGQYKDFKRKLKQNKQIEKDAKAELCEVSFSTERAKTVIGNALLINELGECSKLFNKFLEGGLFVNTKMAQVTPNPNTQTAKNINVVDLTKVVRGGKIPRVDVAPVNLQGALSKVLQLLANDIQAQEAIIDLNIDSNILVEGKDEILEQIFFNVFKIFLAKSSNFDGQKKLTSSIKKLGGTLILNFETNTNGFNVESAKSANVETLICEELMRDIAGTIQFENLYGDKGKVSGGKIQLILRSADKEERKLVVLKKGTKQELLREFQQTLM